MIRARIAFEREIASRWHLAVIAYGLVCVTVIASEPWRDGWAIFAAALLLPVLLSVVATREGSGSDSWFRGLGGSAVADTVGRTVGHSVLVGLPFAVHTILAADVISYMIVNTRIYALVAVLLYCSLVAGRALVSSSAALVAPLAVGISVAASTGLGWVLVGAWQPGEGVLVRLAIVALPLAALAARWDALGTWGAQIGRWKVWSRILVAATIATAFLTAIEGADDRPLSHAWVDDGPWLQRWCDDARDGRMLCEDSRIRRVWMVSEDTVRLLPERDVDGAILVPGGSYVALVGESGSRTIFHSSEGAVTVLEDVDDWMGFSPSGRWAVRTREGGVTIVELDGSLTVTHARDAAWLGEDLLLRTGFDFELWRADGERRSLADVVPLFADPTLDFDDGMLVPRGEGRVQLLTSTAPRSSRLGFVADHVADACARGPDCPGLLEPMSIPRFERVDPPEPQPPPPRARLSPVVAWLRG